jgi:protein-S-isoprenylcysteine O-methyltransferase Ste14
MGIKKGNNITLKQFVLVWIQFAAMLLIGFMQHRALAHAWPVCFVVISVLLAGSAFVAFRKSKFSVMPEPSVNGQLITRGPYRFIRHPMYLAILMYAAGMCLHEPSWPVIIVASILFINMLIKIEMEEKLLAQQYKEDFARYSKNTYKLIPGVW